MEDNSNRRDEVYSKRIKAGKRTYFFDVKETRGNDFYITITESKRKQDGFGYSKHKIFLYKEDFNKFITGLNEVVNHIKTDLMPEYDFEKYDHEASHSGDSDDDLDFGSFDEIEELEVTKPTEYGE
jgi:viroplasmin and RNaseH domain-containing protein